MSELNLDEIEESFRNLSAYESSPRDNGLALIAEVRRLRAANDAEVLLSRPVVEWAAEAIEQAQVRGRIRVANRLGLQGRVSAARAVLDVARAALTNNEGVAGGE